MNEKVVATIADNAEDRECATLVKSLLPVKRNINRPLIKYMKNETFKRYEELKSEITSILNRYSWENRSNTPDFILAEYMLECLTVYENTVNSRDKLKGK